MNLQCCTIFLPLSIFFLSLPNKKVLSDSSTKPNILLILADDLEGLISGPNVSNCSRFKASEGWNDIGWNNAEVLTPNLDSLAREGIILENLYSQPMCTPSRAALLTGIYPFRYGLQDYVISPINYKALTTKLKTLANHLKDAGYSTHKIGKWHLGYCNKKFTPVHRGFDSFIGFFNGAQNYFNHTFTFTSKRYKETFSGYDFWEGTDPALQYNGTYSSNIFTERAVKLIQGKKDGQSLFIDFSFQNPHWPLEVEKKYSDLYPDVKNVRRKIYLGMISNMDEAIGHVVKALKDKRIYNETLIVFLSDNGGEVKFMSSNFPYRGSKGTLYEGSSKVPAFFHGYGINKKGGRHSGLMHFTDLFPTLLHFAGVKLEANSMDGIDQFEAVTGGEVSKREYMVYNLVKEDPWGFGVRYRNFKLIAGKTNVDLSNQKYLTKWYKASTIEKIKYIEYNYETKVKKKDQPPDSSFAQFMEKAENVKDLVHANFSCIRSKKEARDLVTLLELTKHTQLFDLDNDPLEVYDLSEEKLDVLLRLILSVNQLGYYTPIIPEEFFPGSNPNTHGGLYITGWCEPF